MYFKLKFLIFCALLLVLSSGDTLGDVPEDSLDDESDNELDEVIKRLEEKVSKLIDQSRPEELEGQPYYNRNLRMANEPYRKNQRRQRRPSRERRQKIIPNCKRWNLCWAKTYSKLCEERNFITKLNKHVRFNSSTVQLPSRRKALLDVCQLWYHSNSFKFALWMCFLFIFSDLSHCCEVYCQKV